MISSLLILDLTGKVILSRKYRDAVPANHADSFMRRMIDDEDGTLGPIFEVDGKTDIYVKHNNIYCKQMKLFFLPTSITTPLISSQ